MTYKKARHSRIRRIMKYKNELKPPFVDVKGTIGSNVDQMLKNPLTKEYSQPSSDSFIDSLPNLTNVSHLLTLEDTQTSIQEFNSEFSSRTLF